MLNVTGTTGAEQVYVLQTNNAISLKNVSGSWSTSQVKSIVIDLKGGGDTISLDSLHNGGNKSLAAPVTIKSGSGTEVVTVVTGHQVSLSGAGHTLVVATSGTATLDGQVVNWSAPTPPAPTPPTNTNWFDTHITDAALKSLGHSLFTDNLINRNDMISLLRSAEDGGIIDATEMTDLKAIVANTSLFGTGEYVDKLAADVVNGSVANAKYLGQTLGNLGAGSTTAKMENLIGKWFLGTDHPVASGDAYHQYSAYRQFSGTLFVNGATYTDIKQGYLGDCYFMSTLGEVALRNSSAITNMFIVNGDGTYTVKFFNNGQANYVTVDSYLPTDSAGRAIYAGLGMVYNNTANELWTALAEKAYVQLNELGWERVGLSGNGQNAYASISGGYVYAAQGQVTGQNTVSLCDDRRWNKLQRVCHGVEPGQVDRLRFEVDSGFVHRCWRARLCGRRLQRRKPDRDAVQSVGHSVWLGNAHLEPDPSELRLLRSDGVIGERQLTLAAGEATRLRPRA